MKKTIAAMIIPILVLSFIGLSSCKDKKDKGEKQRQKTEAELLPKIEKEIPKNVYPLPTSASVIKQLTDLDVTYIPGISNPAENVKKYYTNAKRAVNLGLMVQTSVMQHFIIIRRR